MSNKYFILYANCIAVKGHSQSLICDLEKSNYQLIPNIFYDILLESKIKTVNEIKVHFDNQYDDGIDMYFERLNTEDLGFFTDEPQNFSNIDLGYNTPSIITNALIDINEIPINLDEIIVQLDKLGCHTIQLRFFEKVSISDLNKILDYTDNKRFRSVELYLKYTYETDDSNLLSILDNYRRVSFIAVYNSSHKRKINGHNIFYVNDNNVNEKSCGKISQNYFTVNYPMFTESQKLNSCLNQKISVDVNGEIKN